MQHILFSFWFLLVFYGGGGTKIKKTQKQNFNFNIFRNETQKSVIFTNIPEHHGLRNRVG